MPLKTRVLAFLGLCLAVGTIWLFRTEAIAHRESAYQAQGSGAEPQPGLMGLESPELPDDQERIEHSALSGPAPSPEISTRDIPPTTRVSVVVVDERDRPIAGASLSVAELAAAQADAIGRASVNLGPLGDASPWVDARASASGFATATRRVLLQSGRDHHLGRIRLEAEARVAGRLTSPDGAPLEGVSVYLELGTDSDLSSRVGPRQFPAAGASARYLGSHIAPRMDPHTPRAVSDGEGRFEFTALPAGWARVWAIDPAHFAGFTQPTQVRPGETAVVGDVVLERVDPSRAVRGRVLQPDGTPAAGARVAPVDVAWYEWVGVRTGEDGSFNLPLGDSEVVDIVASDVHGHLAPVTLNGVAAGTGDLEARLGRAPGTLLLVQGDAGGRLASFGYELKSTLPGASPMRFSEELRGGDYALHVPPGPFALTVFAHGYHTEQLGTFHPGDLPLQIAATLEANANVRGFVTNGAEPISGAIVEARATVDGAETRVLDLDYVLAEELGATCELPAWRTVTDERGAFQLLIPNDSACLLRAQAPGYGPSRLVGITAESEPLELVLSQPAGIDGSVVDSDGDASPGWVIAATAGDGYVDYARTDDQGRFAMEGLGAGPHALAVLAKQPGTQTPTLRAPRDVARATQSGLLVELQAGERQSVEIVVPRRGTRLLSGSLTLEGINLDPDAVGGGRWTAWLHRPGSQPDRGPSVQLDAQGYFEFALDSDQPVRIILRGSLATGERMCIVRELDPSSDPLHWDQTVPLGTLGATLATTMVLSPFQRLVCVTQLPSGAEVHTDLELQPGRTVASTRVAAGPLRLALEQRDARFPAEQELPFLAKGNLTVGGSLDLNAQ